MRRFWTVGAAALAFFLMLFLITEALRIPILADPTRSMSQAGTSAAATGVFLLVIDALIPVPSSLVMIAHGALFGILTGTILSLIGSLGAASVGFSLGKAGGSLIEGIIGPHERERAERLLDRWGRLAVVVTRPIPLLAETVALMAGASGMKWSVVVACAALGSLPTAVVYAWAGATGRAGNGVWVFLGVLALAGALLAFGRLWNPTGTAEPKPPIEPEPVSSQAHVPDR